MAPSCFSKYRGYTSYALAEYACLVVFLAVYLGILVALCFARRRAGSGKKLIGLPYMLALLFVFIEQALNFIFITIRACETRFRMHNYYDWSIAINIFHGINTFLLLFVVIYTLNTMLRKQLGHNPPALKLALGLNLFILGGLLLAYVVIRCYIFWSYGRDLTGRYTSLGFNPMDSAYVGVTFDALYLVSVLASSVLSILAARSLKKKHIASGSLLIWTTVLGLSLFLYSLIILLQASSMISYNFYMSSASFTALYWVTSFSRALTFIVIIIIARNPVWRSNTGAGTGPMGQQHAYNWQHDSPVYTGAGQRA